MSCIGALQLHGPRILPVQTCCRNSVRYMRAYTHTHHMTYHISNCWSSGHATARSRCRSVRVLKDDIAAEDAQAQAASPDISKVDSSLLRILLDTCKQHQQLASSWHKQAHVCVSRMPNKRAETVPACALEECQAAWWLPMRQK